MVEWMERHPDFARGKGHFGSSKQQFKTQEEEIAEMLNSFGPPTRNGSDWHRVTTFAIYNYFHNKNVRCLFFKVWINFKSNVKKKLSNNKQNSKATGGGVSMAMVLSPLEETVANLIHAPLLVNPPGVALGTTEEAEDCGESNKENVPEELPSTSRQAVEENVNEAWQQNSNNQRKPMKRRNRLDKRLKAINKQSNNQAKMIKSINRMEKTLYKMYELSKKQYNLESEYRKLKIEIAKKQLELMNIQIENNQ